MKTLPYVATSVASGPFGAVLKAWGPGGRSDHGKQKSRYPNEPADGANTLTAQGHFDYGPPKRHPPPYVDVFGPYIMRGWYDGYYLPPTVECSCHPEARSSSAFAFAGRDTS